MPVLTRTGSLSALNALPTKIESQADLSRALGIVNEYLSQLDLPSPQIPLYAPSDLIGAKAAASLKQFVPKVTAALEANVLQSKALPKILGVVSLALGYLGSTDYQDSVIDRLIDSGRLGDLIEEKLADRMGDIGGGRRPRGSQVPDTPMRAPRNMKLEHALHYISHRLVGKRYSKSNKTVVSDVVDWPEGVDAGFVEEEAAGGVVRRWRPDWDVSTRGTAFEAAVVQAIKDEYGSDFAAADDVRAGLESYQLSISRARKEAESGTTARRKATTNVNKRRSTLLQNMLEEFENSVLNACSERAFYHAMITSNAFILTTYGSSEFHGLAKYDSTASDGAMAQYDAFQLAADLWYADRIDPSVVVAAWDVDWWSTKARLGWWCLYEQSKPPANRKPRLPVFHLPMSSRPTSTMATLPRLPVPALPSDSPAASKKAKVETFALTKGMIDDHILNDPAFVTWTGQLPDDPPVDDSLPPLSELLRDDSKRPLSLAAQAHLRSPPSLDLEHLRKLWRVRQEGTAEMYLRVVRSENVAEAIDQVGDEDFEAGLDD